MKETSEDLGVDGRIIFE